MGKMEKGIREILELQFNFARQQDIDWDMAIAIYQSISEIKEILRSKGVTEKIIAEL